MIFKWDKVGETLNMVFGTSLGLNKCLLSLSTSPLTRTLMWLITKWERKESGLVLTFWHPGSLVPAYLLVCVRWSLPCGWADTLIAGRSWPLSTISQPSVLKYGDFLAFVFMLCHLSSSLLLHNQVTIYLPGNTFLSQGKYSMASELLLPPHPQIYWSCFRKVL